LPAPGKFVDNVEHAIFASIMGAVLDKVIGPDMVGVFGPKPNTGAVIEPQAALLGLFGWDAARCGQQGRDPAVPIAAIFAGKGNDIGGQRCLVISCRGKT
jgi:hypothetical protein